jgi:hypothetical protein
MKKKYNSRGVICYNLNSFTTNQIWLLSISLFFLGWLLSLQFYFVIFIGYKCILQCWSSCFNFKLVRESIIVSNLVQNVINYIYDNHFQLSYYDFIWYLLNYRRYSIWKITVKLIEQIHLVFGCISNTKSPSCKKYLQIVKYKCS